MVKNIKKWKFRRKDFPNVNWFDFILHVGKKTIQGHCLVFTDICKIFHSKGDLLKMINEREFKQPNSTVAKVSSGF